MRKYVPHKIVELKITRLSGKIYLLLLGLFFEYNENNFYVEKEVDIYSIHGTIILENHTDVLVNGILNQLKTNMKIQTTGWKEASLVLSW